MGAVAQTEGWAHALGSARQGSMALVKTVNDIWDGMDILHSNEGLQAFLSSVYPLLISKLEAEPPQLEVCDREAPSPRIRHIIVEILNRMPINDAMRGNLEVHFNTAVNVLKVDNQENGILAVKTLLDMFRNYRQAMNGFINPFLNIVELGFNGVMDTIKKYKDSPRLAESSSASSLSFMPALASFRVLQEFPLIVMLLVNMFNQFVQGRMPALVPLFVRVITAAPPASGELPPLWKDLRGLQIKTISFVTYLAKHDAQLLTPHQDAIAGSVIQLLRSCPGQVSTRKELLVAIKHMLGASLHFSFRPHLEAILDESTLVGKGRTFQEQLRPLAHSILAEMLHKLRGDLQPQQLRCIVLMFSCNLHDAMLPVNVQTTCIRLMVSLIEPLAGLRHHQDESVRALGRCLLLSMLESVVSKLQATSAKVASLMELAKEAVEMVNRRQEEFSKMMAADYSALQEARPRTLLHTQTPSEAEREYSDTRTLLDNIFAGIRPLISTLAAYTASSDEAAAGIPARPSGLQDREIRLLSRIFCCGLDCLKLWSVPGTGVLPGRNDMHTLDAIVSILLPLPAQDFIEIIAPLFGHLYKAMLQKEGIRACATILCSAGPRPPAMADPAGVARSFTYVMVTFLVENKLQVLEAPESKEGMLVLKLFRIACGALLKFPDEVEPLLAIPFQELVSKVMKAIRSSDNIKGYLILLKVLFDKLRPHSKVPNLQSELLPLLPHLLALLLDIINGPNCSEELKDMVLELCLRLPAKLQDLLPLLQDLTWPLVLSLRSNKEELAEVALRTLETWVDSLNPEWLEPTLQFVIKDLMMALWALLRQSTELGVKALELLGKMGGRSHKFINGPQQLEYKSNPDHGLRVILTFKPATSFLVPLDRCIAMAVAAVNGNRSAVVGSAAYISSKGEPVQVPAFAVPGGTAGQPVPARWRREALMFLHACLSSVLNLRSPDDSDLEGTQLDKVIVAMFYKRAPPGLDIGPMRLEAGVKTKTALLAEQQVMRLLLSAVLLSSVDEELADVAQPFARGICRHFALLYAAGAQSPPPAPPSSLPPPSSAAAPEGKTAKQASGLRELDPYLFLDAFVDALAHGSRGPQLLGALGFFLDVLLSMHSLRQKQLSQHPPSTPQAEASDRSGLATPSVTPIDTPGPTASGGSGAAAEGSAGAAGQVEEGSATAEGGGGDTAAGNHGGSGATGGAAAGLPGGTSSWKAAPPALDELMDRLLQVCSADDWNSRLGALGCLKLLMRRLPAEYLLTWAPRIVLQLASVMTALPRHSSLERRELSTMMLLLTRKVLLKEELPSSSRNRTGMDSAGAGGRGFGGGRAEWAAVDGGEGGRAAMEVDGTGAGPGGERVDADGDAMMGGSATADGRAVAGEDADGSFFSAAAAVAAAGPPPRLAEGLDADQVQLLLEVLFQCMFALPHARAVREAANACVKLAAESKGKTVMQLLAELETAHAQAKDGGGPAPTPVVGVPLQDRRISSNQPIETAIGNMEAVAFALAQDPPLMEYNSAAKQLIANVLEVCEQPDTVVVSRFVTSKNLNPNTTSALGNPPLAPLMDRLRLACLEILVQAIGWELFRDDPDSSQESIRLRIITVLLHNLMSGNDEQVEQAKIGITKVRNQQQLMKHLLQNALRPILKDLNSWTKVNLPILRGLRRLLLLLASWFKTILGDKLLEHLRHWLDPVQLLNLDCQKAWRLGEEVAVAAAMLDLFHLLPAAASSFLSSQTQEDQGPAKLGLVVLTIELESKLATLHSTIASQAWAAGVVPGEGEAPPPHPGRAIPPYPTVMISPYRPPLAEFLYRHAAEAAEYFLEPSRLASPPYFHRLLDVIRAKPKNELLKALLASGAKFRKLLSMSPLISTAGPGLSPTPAAEQLLAKAQKHTIHLVAALVKLDSTWIAGEPELFQMLLDRWRSPELMERLHNPDVLPLQHLGDVRRIATCLLSYIASHRREVDALIDVVRVFTAKTCVDFSFIKATIQDHIIKPASGAEKQRIVQHILDLFKTRTLADNHMVHILQVVLIPLLETTFKAQEPGTRWPSEIITQAQVDSIIHDLWEPSNSHSQAVWSESLAIEMLRLGTLMIEYISEALVNHRKELIKFGWNHLKHDESLCKDHAFLNVAHFLKSFQAPEKIVLQVFVALLRHTQQDTKRNLGPQALDVLVPSLNVRVPPVADQKHPIWIRYTKKVLLEEQTNLNHMVHIWQLIVRHADLFQKSRSQFVQPMVGSLSRLGMPPNSQIQNRKLALDMVALLLQWEETSLARHQRAQGGPADQAMRSPGAIAASWAFQPIAKDDQPPAEKKLKTESGAVDVRLKAEPGPAGAMAVKAEGAGAAVKEDPAAAARPGAASSSQPSSSVSQVATTSGGGEALMSPPASAGVGGGEEVFKLSSQMEEAVVNFLVRIALLLCDPQTLKAEPASKQLHQYTLQILSWALHLWPRVNIKLYIVDKFLQQQQQQQQQGMAWEASTLRMCLQVFDRILQVQPHQFVAQSCAQVLVCLKTCCTSNNAGVTDLLCSVIQKVFWAFPPVNAPPTSPELEQASKLHAKVEEFIQRHLHARGEAAPGEDPRSLQNGLALALKLLSSIQEVVPDYTAHRPMVKTLVDYLLKQAEMLTQPTKGAAAERPSRSMDVADVPYASSNWILNTALGIIAPHVISSQELRHKGLRAMVLLVTGNATKQCHFSTAMKVLEIVRGWILNYKESVGSLSYKEAGLFLQRLGRVPDEAGFKGEQLKTWMASFLDLLYRVCTETLPPHGKELQTQAFENVEKVFLWGLRSKDTEMRSKFFQLYNSNISSCLHSRLSYIVTEQKWEHASRTFWLKPALDLLLALMKEKEAITLAPHSAMVVPLLPATRSPVFSMSRSQPAGGGGAGSGGGGGTTDVAGGDTSPGGSHRTPPQPLAVPGQPANGPVQAAAEGAAANGPMGGAGASVASAAPQAAAADAAGAASRAEAGQHAAPGPAADATAATAVPDGLQRTGSASSGASVPTAQTALQTAGAGAANALDRQTTSWMELPEPELEVLREHTQFLHSVGQANVSTLMRSLQEYAEVDADVAYHLWVLVFPIVWATLDKAQQVQLAKPIITLLSKEYHINQADHRPNVVQALLEGISLSQPQPKIPPELILFLGKTFNAWHIAIPLLESHVVIFPQESRCFDALALLYSSVGEHDVMCGLWKKLAATESGFAREMTKNGLTLMQVGSWDSARKLFYEANKVALSTHREPSNNSVPRNMQALWLQSYVNCAQQLCQWDMLTNYAESAQNLNLLMECQWRNGMWKNLKEATLPSASTQGPEQARFFMIRAMVALQEGHVHEADTWVKTSMEELLQQWWKLPRVGSWPQIALLQQFQRVVELQESNRILLDIAAAQQPGLHSMTLQEICETWRLRVPNDWDDLLHWNSLLMWRNHIYHIIISAFSSETQQQQHPKLYSLGYRDKAWSVNRLAAVALKHGAADLALWAITNMYQYGTMEVQEAFVKITIQCDVHAQLGDRESHFAGLNLLHNTRLDYFGAEHHSELMRFKGLFHQPSDPALAEQFFSYCCSLNNQNAKGWLSWGKFCNAKYDASANNSAAKLDEEAERLLLLQTVLCYSTAIRLGSTAARGMVPRLLVLLAFENKGNAVGQALEEQLAYLPASIWVPWIPQLMNSFQQQLGTVKAILNQVSQAYPQAVYYLLRTHLLHWRDQVQRCLVEHCKAQQLQQQQQQQQQDGTAAATVAAADSKSAAAAPPAGDGDAMPGRQSSSGVSGGSAAAAAANGTAGPPGASGPGGMGSGGGSGGKPMAIPGTATQQMASRPEMQLFDAGKELINRVRSASPAVAAALEMLLQELGSRFMPRPEERLLAIVNALLHRCYKMPIANDADIPSNLRKELSGVCRACFSDSGSGSASRRPSGSGEMGGGGSGGGRSDRLVNEKMKESFMRDLHPENDGFPTTLEELASVLKGWRIRLLSRVDDSAPPIMALELESRVLSEMMLVDVEMPGHHLESWDGAPDSTVFLDRIGSKVRTIRRHCQSNRMLEMWGSDGNVRYMALHTGATWVHGGVIEERVMQLCRVMNQLLAAAPACRRRHLSWLTPIVLPIWPQVRLVQEEPSYCTYGETYEVNSARYGKEPDMPIALFKRRCFNNASRAATGAAGQAATGYSTVQAEVKYKAYQEITSRVVSENVFSQYMYKTLPSCNHLWAFKRQLCAQLALSSLLTYMLYIGGRCPNKLLFSKDSGKVYQTDIVTCYDTRGMLTQDRPDGQPYMPYRLTRNLVMFFTPFSVEGIFLLTQIVSAAALTTRDSNLADFLWLFFRDDFSNWYSRRSSRTAAHQLPSSSLRKVTMHNVMRTLERLRQLAPTVSDELLEQFSVTASGQSNKGVAPMAREALEAATRDTNLCRMEPTWHPWF